MAVQEGKYHVRGLPDGLQFKTVGAYSREQLRSILSAANSIEFQPSSSVVQSTVLPSSLPCNESSSITLPSPAISSVISHVIALSSIKSTASSTPPSSFVSPSIVTSKRHIMPLNFPRMISYSFLICKC